MPRLIIKPARELDEYVEWSTIVEAPTALCSRAEMLDYLGAGAADRLDRADEFGSSAMPEWGFGQWDDDEFIYEQRGYLPRARLAEAARLLIEDRDSEVWDLMTPFEDEAEVRRG